MGDTDYFNDSDYKWWEFSKKRNYSGEIVDIINDRTDSLLKFIPVKESSPEEVSAFLEWICTPEGQIDEEKLKYYTLLQEKAQLADNNGTWEAFRRIVGNMDIDPNSDEFRDQIGTILKNTVTEQSEANRTEIRELLIQHRDAITEMEEVIDIVKDTEKGVTDGLSSRISNNPVNVMEAGGVVGAGIGIAKKVKNGFFGKVGKLIKRIFGKKAKALPPSPNIEYIGEKGKTSAMREIIKVGSDELSAKQSQTKDEIGEEGKGEETLR